MNNSLYSHEFGNQANESKDSLTDRSNHLEIPLGDQDRRGKVQLCIELREVTKAKKPKLFLDVVVMQTKYLQSDSKHQKNPPTPYVKLRLTPDDLIMCTDLKETGKDIYFYGEPFTFPVQTKPGLKGKKLQIEVCDQKVTRNAQCFGHVKIPLDDYKVGKPSVQWYYLENGSASV